jgi:hypothetical protein
MLIPHFTSGRKAYPSLNSQLEVSYDDTGQTEYLFILMTILKGVLPIPFGFQLSKSFNFLYLLHLQCTPQLSSIYNAQGSNTFTLKN